MLDSFHSFSILPQVNSCDWSEPANTGTGCRVIRIQSPSTSKSRMQISLATLTICMEGIVVGYTLPSALPWRGPIWVWLRLYLTSKGYRLQRNITVLDFFRYFLTANRNRYLYGWKFWTCILKAPSETKICKIYPEVRRPAYQIFSYGRPPPPSPLRGIPW